MSARQLVTLSSLGLEDAMLLVQQACGIPDPKALSHFMESMTVVMLFAKEAYPERLCLTAAVRQMSGSVVYVWPGSWKNEVQNFPEEISHITQFYTDCSICHGMLTSVYNGREDGQQVPLFHAGGPDAHPMHALADIACMYQYTSCDLKKAHIAWIGRATGTLHSLLEGLEYFPYSMSISLPNPDKEHPNLLEKIAKAGDRVRLDPTPQEAVQGANFVCAGKRIKTNEAGDPTSAWSICPELMELTAPNAHIMLSASPMKCVPIAHGLLRSPASLLYKQAEHRLRVSKRILHWLFGQN